MEAKFYVYVYLDVTKSGQFRYDDYYFEYEPFYVGKGYNKRCEDHLRESSLQHKSFKNNKIKKLLSLGLKPLILKISYNIFEIDAFELEKKLIRVIGRRNLNNGPLTNLTDGGDGIVGLIKTKEHRKNLRISSLGKKMSKEARKKISQSLIGKVGRNTGNKHSEETKRQISESKKGLLPWNAIPVIQLDKENVPIKEWVSALDAAKNLKLSQGNIWSVINGKRKTCGGYIWKLR
jgi:group I intron endonuclease